MPRIVAECAKSKITSMKAKITCQQPTADLYEFCGNLEVDDNVNNVTISNVLLRGSKIKNTEEIIGCAIYTGQDAKLSMNSKIKTMKFSTAERFICDD